VTLKRRALVAMHIRDREARSTEANACYSCPGEIETMRVRLGSPQCQDCRDADQPIKPERFLARSRRFVDGIDMAAIAEQLVRPSAAELDGLRRAA
jgi:hypothetical protein